MLRRYQWLSICLLASVAQLLLGGYHLGAGNQTIQIPFLQHLLDPSLYSNDAMVQQTQTAYPTFFFHVLALLAHLIRNIPALYLTLHVLTTFCLNAAIYVLVRTIFHRDVTALLTLLLLVAGHHHALAGEELYSPAFTHTYATFPIAILALVFLYQDRWRLAFVTTGILFNFHALTSAYLMAFLFPCFLLLEPDRFTPHHLKRIAICLGLFLLTASPTIVVMLRSHQHFDATWLALTHIRSADHSFPSSWWQRGNPDLPRFAILAALAVLGLSSQDPGNARRKTLLIAAASGALFLAGWLFADILPINAVIRAQLFRASRLLLILIFAYIAHWIISSRRSGLASIELVSGIFLFLTLAVPSLLGMLPLALVVVTLVSLLNARLSISAASAATLAGLVALAASVQIDFPLLTLPGHLSLTAPTAFGRQADPWTDVQLWARSHTPPSALFLTPTQPGGFRIHSQRSIVGEWRDGTQLYFSASFAPTWWSRMTDLNPGILRDKTGQRLLSPGRSLSSLDDQLLLSLAAKYHATHLVLEKSATPHALIRLYENRQYAIYLPSLPAQPRKSSPPISSEAQFMRDVVYPNIEKYRKSDASIEVLDQAGHPVDGALVSIHQTHQAFKFSASLPFFESPAIPQGVHFPDYRPPPVTQKELDRFLEIFNYSLIPFSGKWMYVEPKEGQLSFRELDKYVDWCTAHHIPMQFHFVSGYIPAWLAQKRPEEQAALFLGHARQLAQRYGDKIDSWQIVNEKILLQESPPVFAEMRRLLPKAKLGMSDCASFWPEGQVGRFFGRGTVMRGLAEIEWLKNQGVQLDFFAFHGHQPFGLWPDVREMYKQLDTYAAQCPHIWISEFTCPMGGRIIGPGRSGTWTPQLQADYYEQFYTVCFSHPNVDMINLWGIGPYTWQRGSGLLDSNFNPKPNFYRLKELIKTKWMTNLNARSGVDGAVSFRGFHGDYEVTVKWPGNGSARPVVAKMSVEPGSPNRLVVRLNALPPSAR